VTYKLFNVEIFHDIIDSTAGWKRYC